MILPWIRQRSSDDKNLCLDDPVVETFVRQHFPPRKTFVSWIDENDEMFLFDLKLHKGDRRRTAIAYYTLGSRIFGTIKQIGDWHFKSLKHAGSFLDFASGYGRSTRFLRRVLAPKRVWACDIYPDAVESQKRHHGVNGIVSVSDPADFPRERKFDFIFSSSFFSHMPETTFSRWMETLYGLLTDRGILVFSTHDTSLLPPWIPAPETGIFFVPESESRTLDLNQYGLTYVSEEFVSRTVERVTEGQARLHRINRGLVCFQDIYIVAKHLRQDFTALKLFHDPAGYLDIFQHNDAGKLYLSGWAADFNVGGRIEKVQILSDGKLIGTTVPHRERTDVVAHFRNELPSVLRSGWDIHLSKFRCTHESIIEVKCTNIHGKSATFAFDHAGALMNRVAKAG